MIYPRRMTAVTVSMTNKTLSTIVTQNRVFSIPRLAVNTPPESIPVRPPSPMPLFCSTTLVMRAIEVIISAMSMYVLKMNLLE